MTKTLKTHELVGEKRSYRKIAVRNEILDDIERYTCIWHHRDNLSFTQIAHLMGKSKKAIEQIYAECAENGMRDMYLRSLTSFGRQKINWGREVKNESPHKNKIRLHFSRQKT